MHYQYENTILIRAIDGDTLDCHMVRSVGFGVDAVIKMRFRMNGINCSEVKGGTPEQKERGQRAKKRLEELLKPLSFRLDSHKPSKFGNYLCDIYLADGRHVNQLLIDEGLAVFYDGTTQRLARTVPGKTED